MLSVIRIELYCDAALLNPNQQMQIHWYGIQLEFVISVNVAQEECHLATSFYLEMKRSMDHVLTFGHMWELMLTVNLGFH
jgi:hypothetical protein